MAQGSEQEARVRSRGHSMELGALMAATEVTWVLARHRCRGAEDGGLTPGARGSSGSRGTIHAEAGS